MVTYTVHEREEASGALAERAQAIVFIKDGFAWAALIFPVLWLLYHRMWIVLAGFVLLLAVLRGLLPVAGLNDAVLGLAMAGVSVLFAFQANDLRRWSLARKGYWLLGPVSGASRAACEARFFDAWLSAQGTRKSPGPGQASLGKTARTSDAGDDVIGLFPEPGG